MAIAEIGANRNGEVERPHPASRTGMHFILQQPETASKLFYFVFYFAWGRAIHLCIAAWKTS